MLDHHVLPINRVERDADWLGCKQLLERLIDLVANVHHVLALPHRNTEGDRLDAIETNEVEGLIHRLPGDPSDVAKSQGVCLTWKADANLFEGFNRTKRIADVEGRPAIFKIDGGRGPDADFAIEPVDHRIERNTQSDQRLMVKF